MPITLLETAASNERFNLLRLAVELRSHFDSSSQAALLSELETSFGEKSFKKIFARIIRAVFFIEPVNRDITSTKFDVRWASGTGKFFEFGANDPRFCTFQDCFVIFDEILNSLHVVCSQPEKKINFRRLSEIRLSVT